jgi:hypothetical protein
MIDRELEFNRYESFLEYERARLAGDLGEAAVLIVSGGAINTQPSLTPERRAPEVTDTSVDSRRFWGSVMLRQEILTSEPVDLDPKKVMTGYAKQENWTLIA